ncbi:DUF2188 domain-containing protein [Dokdonella fugitiva]|jgi:hypothetical protein|uniref:DUF2188 domain-containing protein n=1 Tax=Dokdonella fugitiva TaxID=328517 RepID=UPI0015F91AEF|nr:DUF2188 domain-containing protein [Dokdonella fugitiva]MBA8883326.1 hypothetical protein [Dokdonella fugitiva]
MSRYVVHLAESIDEGLWKIRHENEVIAVFDTKAEAQKAAEARCATVCRDGQDAQLVIHEAGCADVELRFDPEHFRCTPAPGPELPGAGLADAGG